MAGAIGASSDQMASEHIQVMTSIPEYLRRNMTIFGAHFLALLTSVSYGDA